MELIVKKVVSKTDATKTYTNYYLVLGDVSIQVKPSFNKDYVKLSTLAKIYAKR